MTSLYHIRQNSKALNAILYFILEKMSNKESLYALKPCYPPRTMSETLEFRSNSYIILQELEKDGKVLNLHIEIFMNL